MPDDAGVALRRHPPHRHAGGGAPYGLIAATAYVRGIVDVLRLMRARAVSGLGSLQGVEDVQGQGCVQEMGQVRAQGENPASR